MPVGAVAGAGIASAGANYLSSSSASSAQTRASREATQAQMQMYNQTRSDLSPYRDLGAYAGGQLQNRLTELTSPVVMDQAAVEATPGYKFNLSQGLKAGQNSAAARGLGLSGAAIKAATGYATGLADSTYQQQFSNAVTNQTNAFNRLLQTTSLGSSAASGQAAANLGTGQAVANNITGAGNAQGAAAIAGGNALSSAFNTAGQAANSYWGNGNNLNRLLNPSSGSGLSGFRDDQWY